MREPFIPLGEWFPIFLRGITMSPDKKFAPTPEMIEAADAVFLAMANLSLVQPIVRNYQMLILREGQWRVKRAYVKEGESDEVVLDPDHSFLMEDDDFALYDGHCQRARILAGLPVKTEGNCPLLEAKSALSDAQGRLVQAMATVTGHSLDQLLMFSPENYQKYVDLTLRLLAPFADPHSRYHIEKPVAA